MAETYPDKQGRAYSHSYILYSEEMFHMVILSYKPDVPPSRLTRNPELDGQIAGSRDEDVLDTHVEEFGI
jgi:hypothetical protein